MNTLKFLFTIIFFSCFTYGVIAQEGSGKGKIKTIESSSTGTIIALNGAIISFSDPNFSEKSLNVGDRITFAVAFISGNPFATGLLFDNSPQYNIYDYIGYWHNVALERTFNNGTMNNNYQLVRQNIINSLNQTNPNLFLLDELQQVAIKSDVILSEIGLVNGNSLLFNTESFDNLLVYLNNKNKITRGLMEELSKINKLVNSNSITKEDFIYRINNLPNFNFGLQDQLYILVFMQVAIASDNYWGQGGGPQEMCDLCVIWADAAGAAYGLALGPLGSIIEGALFSSLAAIQ